MSIPGEDLPDCLPASSFVGWYNGHPDYRDLPPTFPASGLSSSATWRWT